MSPSPHKKEQQQKITLPRKTNQNTKKALKSGTVFNIDFCINLDFGDFSKSYKQSKAYPFENEYCVIQNSTIVKCTFLA